MDFAAGRALDTSAHVCPIVEDYMVAGAGAGGTRDSDGAQQQLLINLSAKI